MPENKKVHYIPAKPPKRDKRVGIYCRVSTNSLDQLKSLTAQVSGLTRLVAATPQWLLVDVYRILHPVKQVLLVESLQGCWMIANPII